MIGKLSATTKAAGFSIWIILTLAIALTAPGGQAEAAAGTETLARVEVKVPIQTLGLPVYAHLRDQAGNDYALVIAPLNQIVACGASYQILDDPASPGSYYIARERRKGARAKASGLFTILYDDGRLILVKGAPEIVDQLSGLGFDIKALPLKPMILKTPVEIHSVPAGQSQAFMKAVTYDSRVATMISQVQSNTLYAETGNLTGENAVTISGGPYTITTRATASGTPIQMATQYVYERMAAMGLSVTYGNWSAGFNSGRNVIGAKTGSTRPSEIVLLTAHLDDMPSSGAAPGADDNGSGSAALLMIAGIMASNTFERTVRFVFFTGEEQGLYGSTAYASAASSAGDNIIAVINMDMIAWDFTGAPILRLHTRTSASPGYSADQAIAGTFTSVVTTYSLSSGLTPIATADGETASDHSSFWDHGYAAILAIEDGTDDFNPYYHTASDRRQYFNMAYFTGFTKAILGTVAHLAYYSSNVITPGENGGGGCFIATAAFGSPMA
ncbi:MAG TPA: M28 family metallopeptidase, partial [Smithellaceae bacterium]|nr:M28 family metallopeptidase [Smithellaceae bacterium]